MNYPIDKLHLLTLHVGLANHNGDVEVSACSTDMELIKRLCYINPFLKLPQSDPNAYDNHQTLINNIQLLILIQA